MAKIVKIILLTFLAVALCSAEAPKSRSSRIQGKPNRYFARQVAAETDAVTPYPTADELKPEVPFNEATPAEDQQSNQPDEVYGAPEDETFVKSDGVAVSDEEQSAVEEEIDVGKEQSVAEDEYTPVRLTARRTISARKTLGRPAKLRKSPSGRLQLKPQFAAKPVFFK